MSIEQMLVTDREGGRGVDPREGGGYQVAARSPGLDDPTCKLIHDHCVPLAAALEIADATRKERAWHDTLPPDEADHRSHPYPAEVLQAFPVIWSCQRIEEGRQMLAQVRYLGWCRADPRSGNFLAHALVYAPDDLAPCGYNPLALSRSSLVRSTDDGVTMSLPVIPQISRPPEKSRDQSLLLRPPYREQVAALVSSLMTPSKSPLLLCLADWRHGPQLLEDLLDLLPSPVRCRMTFCSFASRTRMEGSPRILMACGEDVASFNLFPGSYQPNADYLVFNFVEGKHLSVSSPTRYAALMAQELPKEQPERLKKCHALVGKLKLTERANWDRLVAVARLDESSVELETIKEAVSFLAESAGTPGVAVEALNLVQPVVQRLILAGKATPLHSIAPQAAIILDAAMSQKGGAPVDQFLSEAGAQAGDALDKGQIRLTVAVLETCGRAKGQVFQKVLEKRLLPVPCDAKPEKDSCRSGPEPARTSPGGQTPFPRLARPSDEESRRELVKLLLDGVRLATTASAKVSAPFPEGSAAAKARPMSVPGKEQPGLPVEGSGPLDPFLGRLLVALFRAAEEVAMASEVWNRLGDTVVKPVLGKGKDQVQRDVLRELAVLVPDRSCARASVWLNLTFLRLGGSNDTEFCSGLERLATTLSHSPDRESLKEAVELARDRLRDLKEQTIAIGRMIEKTPEKSQAEDDLYREYQANMPDARPAADRIRREVAAAGVKRPIIREFLERVLPWDDEQSPRRVESWMSGTFKESPSVLDEVRKRVARDLQAKQDLSSVEPLVCRLLVRPQGEQDVGPGYLRLYAAVISALPMTPIEREWKKALAESPAGLEETARARFDTMQFLGKIKERASSPDWSVTEFPCDDPAWKGLRRLGPDDTEQAVNYCLETFQQTGVSTCEQAHGLWKMMTVIGAGSPEMVAEANWRLVGARDSVSTVVTAMAYGQSVLEDPDQTGDWAEIFAQFVDRFDPSTRRLLGQHLELRARRHSRNYEKGMRALCEKARLSKPRWLEQPAPSSPLPGGMQGGGAESEGPSLLDRLTGFFRGKRKPPEQDDTGRSSAGSDDRTW